MVISVWTILLAVLAAGVFFRLLRHAPHFGALLVVAALVVVWAAASRSQQEASQSRMQRQLSAQTAALAKQHAAFAKQAAQAQINVARQAGGFSEQDFALKMHADVPFNQRIDIRGPNITIPTPPTPPSITLSKAVAMPAPPSPVVSVGVLTIAWGRLLIVALPALAALAALASVGRSRRRAGKGLGFVVGGVAALVLVAYFFVGKAHVGTTPLVSVSDPFGHDEPAVTDDASRESIDAIWERLSAPQIKLESSDVAPELMKVLTPNQVTAAQAKLNEAAKVLEEAAEKMTDKSSQSWLVVMAEAMLKATAGKTPDAKTLAQPVPPDKAALPAVAAAPAKALPPSEWALEPEAKPRSARGKLTPDWVIHPPGIVGNVRKFVVHAGPYKTLEECHQQLEQQMRDVVQSRIGELTATAAQQSNVYPNLFQLGIGTDYILRELCTEEFVEVKEFDFGDMLTAHALMEFTQAQDSLLVDRWTAFARRASVARTTAGAGLVVGCLALAFGLLKVDTWTRGYYTKRLFLGVPAAIIAVVMLIDAFG